MAEGVLFEEETLYLSRCSDVFPMEWMVEDPGFPLPQQVT